MSCKGIFVTPEAMRSLFNYELMLKQGGSLIERNDFDGDPNALRILVERGLRKTAPHVTVSFWDAYFEMPIENPGIGGDYCLLINQDAPMYSTRMH